MSWHPVGDAMGITDGELKQLLSQKGPGKANDMHAHGHCQNEHRGDVGEDCPSDDHRDHRMLGEPEGGKCKFRSDMSMARIS